ncbi:pilus assembly FimT family protein [Crassaminicella profunda]|uniref:pilus assembly FimT family protein n=1 Tax=Crassaminicella profunda TaxID=1286698 RepID=UPI001CA6D113|nr:prepilin-type N-terminal cleavage/methylation domain-containing protein [Crassaminicella profunda]QZY56976.1 prepilin-type N-terminal cleavage/methylation domain-containing protein [Crassaminicella profunda]
MNILKKILNFKKANIAKGFTLIEILLVLSLMSIFSLMSISINKKLYNTILLETTVNKVKSALLLAQNLSIAETNFYCFEYINSTNIIRVRQRVVGGKVIFKEKLNSKICIEPSYFNDVIYNPEGNTQYHAFYLVHKNNKKKIKIQTMVGTGRIKISKTY